MAVLYFLAVVGSVVIAYYYFMMVDKVSSTKDRK
jgi:NADH:ubiquinone oxidoreductase subunit 2 (subunit N)